MDGWKDGGPCGRYKLSVLGKQSLIAKRDGEIDLVSRCQLALRWKIRVPRESGHR